MASYDDRRVAWVCHRCKRYFMRAPFWAHVSMHGRDRPVVPMNIYGAACVGPAVLLDPESVEALAVQAAFRIGGHEAVDGLVVAQEAGDDPHPQGSNEA